MSAAMLATTCAALMLACTPQPTGEGTGTAPATTGAQTSTGAHPVATGAAQPAAAATAAKMTLRQILEQGDKMTPAQVAAQVPQLTQDEALMLSLFGALGSTIYRYACQATPILVVVIGGAQKNCAMLIAEYQQAVGFVGVAGIAQNVENERQQVLISYKCSTGELDKASCQAYMGTMQRIQDAQNDTSQRILENIGNKCRVGVDPNCQP